MINSINLKKDLGLGLNDEEINLLIMESGFVVEHTKDNEFILLYKIGGRGIRNTFNGEFKIILSNIFTYSYSKEKMLQIMWLYKLFWYDQIKFEEFEDQVMIINRSPDK